MSDTSLKNQDALLHGYTPPKKATREPRRGEEVWRLARVTREVVETTHADQVRIEASGLIVGELMTCELLDDSSAGAGWETILRIDGGELILGHRSGTPAAARHAAEVFRQDHLRQGWAEIVEDRP